MGTIITYRGFKLGSSGISRRLFPSIGWLMSLIVLSLVGEGGELVVLDVKMAVLVFFMLFCASGGVGVLRHELRPGVFTVPPAVRAGRWVELVCAMCFYGLELLGLLQIRGCVSSRVDPKNVMKGLYLLSCGFLGHTVLYLLFC